MRSKKAFKNTIWGFTYEAVHIICAFILPRLILTVFGSQYNGVTGTINQFVTVTTLLQAGIGAVTRAALYKPLAERNVGQISIIVKTTENFLRKVAVFFLCLVVVVATVYPFLVSTEFEWSFVFSLALIMSIVPFFNCYFGETYQLLMKADQQHSLLYIASIISISGRTIIQAVMIHMGFGIREVYLVAALFLVLEPLLISFYAKRKYKIINKVNKDNSTLKQRWDNFGLQVSNFVVVNTGLTVIAVFLDVYEASLFVIYNLILNGVFHLVMPVSRGLNDAFGNMLAKGEHNIAKKNMRIYEQVVFTASTFLYTVAAVTALSFITLYTANVTDVNYMRPALLYIMIAANMFRCFSLPYDGVVNAAGHFRQMRNPAFIEAIICITISVVLTNVFGIEGIAIGMLSAFVYRAVRYAVYLSKNIVPRELSLFFKRVFLSALCLLITFLSINIIPISDPANYLIWALNAVIVSCIAMVIVLSAELLLYRKDLKVSLGVIVSLLGRKPK